MNHERYRQLMRLVHGELSAAEEAELLRVIEGDPALGRELARLQALWDGIPDESPTEIPRNFATGIVRRATGDASEASFPAWSLAPDAVRWAGVAAAATGVLVGISLAPAQPSIEISEEPPETPVEIVGPAQPAGPEVVPNEQAESGTLVGTASEHEVGPEDTGDRAAPLLASPSLAESYWDLVAPTAGGDGSDDGETGQDGGGR